MSGFARRADIWRGGRPASPGPAAIPTGFPALDAELPEGGWPLGALTEVLEERQGIGALSLFLPALAHLSRGGRWIAWFSPPYVPYAPALAMAGVELGRVLLVQAGTRDEGLWAFEQALRSGACGACLGWIGAADFRVLRRLQLAAEAGRGLGVLFRPAVFAVQHSPAALRLRPGPRQAGMALQVLKCRGIWSAGPSTLGLDRDPLSMNPWFFHLSDE
jgi:protein ImuA